MKWGDLFDYVSEKVNFRQKNGLPYDDATDPNDITWTCNHDHTFVKEFCSQHNLDYEVVGDRLRNTGGYCDCEVLWNSVEAIDENSEFVNKL